jgi:hypothetical protein
MPVRCTAADPDDAYHGRAQRELKRLARDDRHFDIMRAASGA